MENSIKQCKEARKAYCRARAAYEKVKPPEHKQMWTALRELRKAQNALESAISQQDHYERDDFTDLLDRRLPITEDQK